MGLISDITLLHMIVGFMAFNGISNNCSVISWMAVLLVSETEVPRESHRPSASH